MRILILTVAGLSSRFCESIGSEVSKCIYFKNNFKEAILSQMLNRHSLFDKIVIVGGFKFNEVKEFCEEFYSDLLSKIVFVKNEEYETTGSGLSLILGINEIIDEDFDELVFAEGDLFVDDESFVNVCNSNKNVITINNKPITAKKSVALYFDLEKHPKYIYDTAHGALEINEPFISIYNSGQIWKFTNNKKLKKILKGLNDDELNGTNLVLINKYFNNLKLEDIDMIRFKEWINCNTIDDFNRTIGRKTYENIN